MDLRTNEWRREMLGCLEREDYRELAWSRLPKIIADMNEPVGQLSESFGNGQRPLVFPTSDDQAAGLVGGGATEPGQVAVILGNSAVVNSSSDRLPESGTLDAMRLNWGPYLWMRCYTNGAQFLDHVLGKNPDWAALEANARNQPPGCGGVSVLPFVFSEPSVGVHAPRFEWSAGEPGDPAVRYRAALEALAYLIALAVREHAEAGQSVERITVSGGIAKSGLMCEILATVLQRPVKRLQSTEGPALGAAVTALAALETHLRRQQGIGEPFGVADAVEILVRYGDDVPPNDKWVEPYAAGLTQFQRCLNA